jgi:ribosome biogenesis SPOUT family RNA methylase Rps3
MPLTSTYGIRGSILARRRPLCVRAPAGDRGRTGAVVASMRRAVVQRGAFTLGQVNLQIDWADRVAITVAEGQVTER